LNLSFPASGVPLPCVQLPDPVKRACSHRDIRGKSEVRVADSLVGVLALKRTALESLSSGVGGTVSIGLSSFLQVNGEVRGGVHEGGERWIGSSVASDVELVGGVGVVGGAGSVSRSAVVLAGPHNADLLVLGVDSGGVLGVVVCSFSFGVHASSGRDTVTAHIGGRQQLTVVVSAVSTSRVGGSESSLNVVVKSVPSSHPTFTLADIVSVAGEGGEVVLIIGTFDPRMAPGEERQDQ
jgi:hypothetical protein